MTSKKEKKRKKCIENIIKGIMENKKGEVIKYNTVYESSSNNSKVTIYHPTENNENIYFKAKNISSQIKQEEKNNKINEVHINRITTCRGTYKLGKPDDLSLNMFKHVVKYSDGRLEVNSHPGFPLTDEVVNIFQEVYPLKK
jgi:hypothetical protein